MNGRCTAIPSTLGIIADEMKAVAAGHCEGGKENGMERSLARIADALARLADTCAEWSLHQTAPVSLQHASSDFN